MSLSSVPISMAVCLLINLTLLGASLAIGVALAFKFIPIHLPRLRYLVTLAAFFAASIIPVLTTLGITIGMRPSSFPIMIPQSKIVAASDLVFQGSHSLSISPASQGMPSFSVQMQMFVHQISQSSPAAYLVWLWLAVALLLLCREIIGHFRMARARHKWVPAPTALQQELSWPTRVHLYLDSDMGPSAVGCLRPAVVLPLHIFGGITPTALRQIAQHELSHARWRDPQVNSLLRLARAVLWPSVPLWYLQHLSQAEREAAADQAAIEGTAAKPVTSQSALDYAAALLSIAQWSGTIGASSFGPTATHAGGKSLLENRVHRLLKASPHMSLTRLALSVAAMVSGLTGTGILPAAFIVRATAPAGSVARSIVEIPMRPENQAEGPLLISRAIITSFNPENYHIEANVVLWNNTSRRIVAFKIRVAHARLPFRRVFNIYTLTIEPRHSLLARLDWQQGPQPDWGTPNAGVVQAYDVQFEGAIQDESRDLPSRVVFNNSDGATILVLKNSIGEVEEPILKESEFELTSSAIERVTPSFPKGVSSEQESKAILVSVLIDEFGDVIRARSVAGNTNPLLEEQAVEAARRWKFVPAAAVGVPIKAFGTLTFFRQMDFSKGWIRIR